MQIVPKRMNVMDTGLGCHSFEKCYLPEENMYRACPNSRFIFFVYQATMGQIFRKKCM